MMKIIYSLWVRNNKFNICAVNFTLKPRQAKEDNPLVFNIFARRKYQEEEKNICEAHHN